MNNRVLHAIDIKRVGVISAIGAILGSIFLFVDISDLIYVVIAFIGLLLVIMNGIQVYYRVMNHEESSNEMLFDVLGVLSGFLLIVSSAIPVIIIVGLYLGFESFWTVYKQKYNKDSFINEIPRVILSAVLLICGTLLFFNIGKFMMFFKIMGGIVVLISLGYLGYNYYLYKRSGVKVIK